MTVNLNRQQHFAFISIAILGLVYLFAFFSSFFKLFSSLIMQIVFVVSPGYHPQIYSLLINLLGGFTILYLSLLLVRGIYLTFYRLFSTRHHISLLQAVPHQNYLLFSSSVPTAFTAGFLHPQVYLSTALFKICTTSEIKAILHHEIHHLQNLDPLRDLLVNFVRDITPIFPFKNHLFQNYSAATEISCDQYACRRLSTPRPLISALSKILSNNPQLAINLFAANQPSRIQVLTQNRPFSLRQTFTYNLSLVTFFILSSFAISRSGIFTECHHLIACLDSLFQKDVSSVMVHSNGHCAEKQEISCQLTRP